MREKRAAVVGLSLATLTCVVLPASLPAQEVGTVDLGSMTSIVTGPAPARLETFAAEQLRGYLARMYGLSLPVQTGEELRDPAARVILLGQAAVAAGAIGEDELREVRWDGYVIKAKDGRIALAGARPRATLFGVAGFLEHLGCRFYGVTETVPEIEDRKLKEFVLVDKPAFEFRRANVRAWQLKTSYDDVADPTKGANPELFDKDSGSNLWIDHTAGYLVPTALYYGDHPEYFALIGGKRVRSSDMRVALCLSNPEVIRISVERMKAWIEKQPECRIFAITHGDTSAWCQCDACKELDAGGGQTDRNLHWVNAVARELGKEYPDKLFWTLAYINTQSVPRRLKPEPNVIVMYTPWWGLSTTCRIHPYTTCWRSVRAAREMEDWLKWAPGSLGVYDYSIGGPPQIRAREDNLKFWGKRGYRGFWECGRAKGFGAVSDFVTARLLWDPSLDPAKLEQEACDACYGPAGEAMAGFLQAYYHEKIDTGTHKGRNDPEYPQRVLALLNEIEQAAAGTPFQGRVQKDLDEFMKGAHGYGAAERREKLKSYLASGNYAKGAMLPEIEPEQGLQGYERGSLWLSKPRIARKGAADDAQLTRLSAICPGRSPGDAQAAGKMQETIQAIYGIELPVESRTVGKDTKGVILVGRETALASGLIDEQDFKAAGADGVVVRGLDGRIAIAASRDGNLSPALDAFLYILRSRHGGTTSLRGALPKAGAPIIREFTLIDRPPFGPQCGAGGFPRMSP